jgi:CheY-like chemotaxis protein
MASITRAGIACLTATVYDERAWMNRETSPGHATILVVEDEIITRAALSQTLRDHGYEVIEAGSADEALSVLRSGVSVDAVVTDLVMPGSLNGGDLVRVIRAEFTWLIVVMLSGSEPETEVRELLDRYVCKPALPSDLVGYLEPRLSPRMRAMSKCRDPWTDSSWQSGCVPIVQASM